MRIRYIVQELKKRGVPVWERGVQFSIAPVISFVLPEPGRLWNSYVPIDDDDDDRFIDFVERKYREIYPVEKMA